MQTDSFPEITRKTLKKAARNIPVPFTLKLRDHEEPVYCDTAVRIIPGKRLVAFGTWGNKPIVAKLFFEWNKAEKHLKRDRVGIELLTQANVPTPKCLYHGTDQKKSIHVLIFERIVDSCNLDTLWHEKTDIDELTPLMQAVTVELATQHVLGIVQKDLHLKNFLITSKHIYTLDGGSIEHNDGLLPKKESIEHLSLFFAQLGAGTEKLRAELFDVYAQSRSWIVRPADYELLQQSIKQHETQRWLRYSKKIMRDCTAFKRIEKWNSLTLLDRDYQSNEFDQFLANPDVYFAKPDTQILKAGRSSTVIKIKIGQHHVVVKRYNIKGTWHWLRRCLRPTRAANSWRLSHHLRLMGIATAKPIAFIEKNFLSLRNKSYFVMEYIPGEHAGKYFSTYQSDDIRFQQVGKRILTLFKQLAKIRMTHGDLKMTNILIQHERPVIIDLDGMQEHQSKSSLQRAFKKEMQRFMKNWENLPSVRELFQRLMHNPPKA